MDSRVASGFAFRREASCLARLLTSGCGVACRCGAACSRRWPLGGAARFSEDCPLLLARGFSMFLSPRLAERLDSTLLLPAADGVALRSTPFPSPAIALDCLLASAACFGLPFEDVESSRRWPGLVRDSRFGSPLLLATAFPPRLSLSPEVAFALSISLRRALGPLPFFLSLVVISSFTDVRFCNRSGGPPSFSDRSDRLPTSGERLAFSRDAWSRLSGSPFATSRC